MTSSVRSMGADQRLVHEGAQPIEGVGPTLSSYADFVSTYRVFLLFALIIGMVGGCLLYLSAPERYTSTAHMVILATTVSGEDETQTDVSIDSALQLLRSDQVVGEVAREIRYPGGPTALNNDMTTRPIINSRILRLSVRAEDPQTAHQATTAITNRFFEVRRQGLASAATARLEAVDAELSVVESELEAHYIVAEEDETLDPEDAEQDLSDTTGIRGLVTRRAQLDGEKAFLDSATPDPGYLSRPATEPLVGGRSGLAVKVASVATLSLLAGIAISALHRLRPVHPDRGRHRIPNQTRRD